MQTYSAILIHPEVPGGRCSGLLHTKPDGLYLESEHLNYYIPYDKLQLTAGGAGNRFVFLKDKTQEEISVYTSEKSILKDQEITSNPLLGKDVEDSQKSLAKTWTVPLLVFGVLILLIAGLYFAKDAMVRGIANQVPVEWEQKAGDQLFTGLSMQYHFVKNDSLKKEFLRVGAPLFSQVEKQGYKIDLYFVKDPTINAFALPGGKVIVQTGLIANAKSWEEVMGVLGHELAHVTERHHVRGIINNIGIYTLVATFFGDVTAISGTLASVGGDLASLSNSRTFENEADEKGWDYLVEGKINPNGLISFFETLKKEHETGMDTLIHKNVDLSFLSTHPNTQERIEHLKEKAKNYKGTPKPLDGNFQNFKDALLKTE